MIAVFMDPLHGDYTHDDDALLWECEGDVCTDDGALVGCTRLRALRRIPLPALTLEQRIDIAIRAARVVSYDEAFRQWAIGWLSGRNRSPEAARAVRETMPEVATEAADEAAQAALRTVSAPLWAGDLREAVIRSSAGEAAAAAAEAALAKGVRFDWSAPLGPDRVRLLF
jgi:hypothetical protein